MLNTPTLDKLQNLKLRGMLQAFKEQQQSPEYQSLSFEERFGLLVDREAVERDNRRLQTRLKQAAFRQKSCIQDIDYSLQRGLDKSLVLALSSGQWIHKHLNVLITGPAGVGKSFLACALGHQACMQGYSVRYLRLPRLLPELELARAEGNLLKRLNQLARVDLLILDDWGLAVLKDQDRRNILEILDDRHNQKATLFASQLPVDQWYEVIGDATLADAILDRLIHNAYKITLNGESVRKTQAELTRNSKQDES